MTMQRAISMGMTALFAALASTAATAGEPTVQPTWTREITREVVAREDANGDGGWDLHTDGTLVLATGRQLDAHRTFRALAPNGDTNYRRIVDPVGTSLAFTRADPATGGAFVLLTGAAPRCVARHLSAGGAVDFEIDVPMPAGATLCRADGVTPDGKLVVRTPNEVLAITGNGAIAWRYDAMIVGDVVVTGDGAVWIAGGVLALFTVAKLAADGTELMRDRWSCDCGNSFAVNMAPHPSGGVLVVGHQAIAPFGVIARYGANGVRLSLDEIESRVGNALLVDGLGNAYSMHDQQASRFNLGSGAILWTVPARHAVASPSGLFVATQITSDTIARSRLSAFDPGGAPAWVREIDIAANAPVGLRRSGAGVTMLVETNRTTWPDDCGDGPVAIAFDAAGDETSRREACLRPGVDTPVDLDARAALGAIVAMPHEARRFDADGNVTWTHSLCAYCLPYAPGVTRMTGAALTSDGGAWILVATRVDPSGSAAEPTALRRLDAFGLVLGEAVLPSLVGARLVVTRDDSAFVVATDGEPAQLRIYRFGGAATVAWQRTYPLPTFAPALSLAGVFDIDADIERNGIVVSSYVSAGSICTILCPPAYAVLSRVDAADGRETWRHEWYDDAGSPTLGWPTRDGGGVAVVPEEGGAVLRRWDAAGEQLADIPLAPPAIGRAMSGVLPVTTVAAHVSNRYPPAIVGPVHDRWLLGDFRRLDLYDATGRHLASHVSELGLSLLQADDAGIIAADGVDDGFRYRLRDWADLSPRARLGEDLGGRYASYVGQVAPWHVDGNVVHGNVPHVFETVGLGASLHRFDDLPPSNLLFANGNE